MNKGFTLIELLVAVMIVGILTAVSVSSYQSFVLRGDRADAKAVLMEAAGLMERNYSATGSYIVDPAGNAINASPILQSPKSGVASYNLSFMNGTLTASTYTLQAVPTTADAECGTFRLNQLGAQSITGTATLAECWQR